MQTETTNPTPSLDDMARQTAQAKLLREARDQLTARMPDMSKAELIAMGLPASPRDRINPEAHTADEIRDGATFNSCDLAEVLGVSLPTLRNWMAPADNKVHRTMPETAKRLLARILADQPKKERKA